MDGQRCPSSASTAPAQGTAIPEDELAVARKLLITVPYSLHCNFLELKHFVAALAPRDIEGFVKGLTTRGVPHDPKVFFRSLLAPAPAKVGRLCPKSGTNMFSRGEHPRNAHSAPTQRPDEGATQPLAQPLVSLSQVSRHVEQRISGQGAMCCSQGDKQAGSIAAPLAPKRTQIRKWQDVLAGVEGEEE
eukprot:jgi/Botrbrau1/23432/Bobra.0051s0073.1